MKGRPLGSKNRPQPPQEGPLWEAFLQWFAQAQVRGDRRADLWRAFCAGMETLKDLSLHRLVARIKE